MKLAISAAAASILVASSATNAVNVWENLPDGSTTSLEDLLAWSKTLTKIGEEQFKTYMGGDDKRFPSPRHWGDHPVYQVMPDRFNNADASNDNAGNPDHFGWTQDEEIASGFTTHVDQYRHGGDIKGITARLDYLKALGINVVYPTAFMYNRNGDYHGYCVADPLRVDPGFGTLEDLQELVKEAHKRGMYVYVDYVMNHMCGGTDTKYVEDPSFTSNQRTNCQACAQSHFKRNNLGITDNFASQRTIDWGENFFKPFKRQEFFSRCGYIDDNNCAGGWGDQAVRVYGDFTGVMFDLETGNRGVVEMMTEIGKYWIAATDVDGIRMDAVAHVTDPFVAYLSTHFRDYAASLGKNNFMVVGEFFANSDSNTQQAGLMKGTYFESVLFDQYLEELKPMYLNHPTQKYPGFVSYDFGQHDAITDAIGHSSVGNGNVYPILNEMQRASGRAIREESGLNPSDLWMFVEQHDKQRMARKRKNIDPIDNMRAWELSHFYTFMTVGSPFVYYGSEQGFQGDCVYGEFKDANATVRTHPLDDTHEVWGLGDNFSVDDFISQICHQPNNENRDIFSRQTMFSGGGWSLSILAPEQHPALIKETYIGVPKGANPYTDWTKDPFTNLEAPLAKKLARYASIRSGCSALRRGSFHMLSQLMPLLSFSRVYEDQEIVTILNIRREDGTLGDIPLKVNPDGKIYKDLLTGVSFTTEGKFIKAKNLIMAPFSYMVLVREDYIDSTENNDLICMRIDPLDSEVVDPVKETTVPQEAVYTGLALGGAVLGVGLGFLAGRRPTTSTLTTGSNLSAKSLDSENPLYSI